MIEYLICMQQALTNWVMLGFLQATPLIIVLRNAGVLGALQLPNSTLTLLAISLSLLILHPEHLELTCESNGIPPWLLIKVAMDGILFAFVIRQGIFVMEALAGLLESQLQITSDSPRSSTGGALTTLALALFAANWWRQPEFHLAIFNDAPRALIWALALESGFDALHRALRLVVLAGGIHLFAEIGVGSLQRAIPNLVNWQFSLPIRVVLGLHIFRIALLRSEEFGP